MRSGIERLLSQQRDLRALGGQAYHPELIGVVGDYLQGLRPDRAGSCPRSLRHARSQVSQVAASCSAGLVPPIQDTQHSHGVPPARTRLLHRKPGAARIPGVRRPPPVRSTGTPNDGDRVAQPFVLVSACVGEVLKPAQNVEVPLGQPARTATDCHLAA